MDQVGVSWFGQLGHGKLRCQSCRQLPTFYNWHSAYRAQRNHLIHTRGHSKRLRGGNHQTRWRNTRARVYNRLYNPNAQANMDFKRVDICLPIQIRDLVPRQWQLA